MVRPDVNRILPVVLISLLVSAGVSAQALDDRLDMARAAARVEVALAEDPALRPFRIEVDIRDGTLILTGQVDSSEQRIRAEQLTENAGITERIINRIELNRPVGGIAPAPIPSPQTTEAAEITAPTPATQISDPVYHTVQSGETLFAIARRYNVTVSDIQRLNNMSTTTIRAGQRLRIR